MDTGGRRQRTALTNREITVRRAAAADDAEVLALLQTALDWPQGDDACAFFAWKHRQSPLGQSRAWVAEAGGEVVGYRAFLPWRFTSRGAEVDAVRAVDAATHPAWRRHGVFTRLTRQALDELAHEGYEFVFNTPNRLSHAGELKLGWREVGHLPISVTVSGAGSVRRLAGARTAATRDSLPTTAGEPAVEGLGEERLVRSMRLRTSVGMTTLRTYEFLRWRYGFAPLNYRVLRGSPADGGGLTVFRLRRRGAAREAALCELVAETRSGHRALIRHVLRATGADYAVCLGRPFTGLPLPGQGPLLVQRPLAGAAPSEPVGWSLSLGDVELL